MVTCPRCGHRANVEPYSAAARKLPSPEPPPGAFHVCEPCGALNRFRPDGTLRRATRAEIAAVKAELRRPSSLS